ncbi:CPn0927/CPn0928 family alpha/beta hydrolase fold protein [Chlamydia sp. 17-3921]|uniref:CPn0927/CPn0928 family alpha/beta hydrolase fold protein n=1 Tax=Chlamydia sp. 17-3921 TaxID=2675798 RepID=UPI001919D49C|nr:CPn0927/CPn0928 family alpha/beta hydrolase fold protein [Chlamydia sp. 17-3921]
MVSLVPNVILTADQFSYFLEPFPKPKIEYYSSERIRKIENFKRQHLVFVLICRIVLTIIKWLLSLVFFPLGLVLFLGRFCQDLVLPAAAIGTLNKIFRFFGYINRKEGVHMFQNIARDTRVERLERSPIQFDEMIVDTIEMHLKGSKKGRWMLVSEGNYWSMENRFKQFGCRNPFVELASQLDANILFFNYPGVMSSQGPVSKEGLIKSYQGCVRYLKDSKQGLGANEIIAYGISLGAAIQGEALKNEILDGSDNVKWILIKDRAFTSMRDIGMSLFGKFGVWLTRFFCWDMNPVEISGRTMCPEIFIYSSKLDSKAVAFDGKFSPELSFASAFITRGELTSTCGEKIPIGSPLLGHAENLFKELIEEIVSATKLFLESNSNKLSEDES